MPATVFIFGYITVMRVRMRDCVRMRCAVVCMRCAVVRMRCAVVCMRCAVVCMRCAVVCMRKAVLMHMFVLPDPCVDHNERRAACHHDQSDDISTPAFSGVLCP